MTHLGIDISSYQGVPDPEALRALGLDFAYVKVTEGGAYKNPDAPAQVAACHAAGIENVGYYHFVTMDDTLDQLNNLYYMATSLGGTKLPLAFDIEEPDPAGWPALAVKIMQMALDVENWTQYLQHPRTILYADLAFAQALPGFPWGRWVWLADPNPGAPHRPCLVLQGAPRPEGPFANVDPDTFVGSEAAWAAFTGAVEAPPPSHLPPAPRPVIPPTPPTQEDPMAVSQTVTYRPGQYDFFQVDGNRLLHFWHNAAQGWQEEDVREAAGQGAIAPLLTGQPSATVVGGVCVVVAEDTNGAAWVYQQGATGAWTAAKP